jgi:hypothetical protein
MKLIALQILEGKKISFISEANPLEVIVIPLWGNNEANRDLINFFEAFECDHQLYYSDEDIYKYIIHDEE